MGGRLLDDGRIFLLALTEDEDRQAKAHLHERRQASAFQQSQKRQLEASNPSLKDSCSAPSGKKSISNTLSISLSVQDSPSALLPVNKAARLESPTGAGSTLASAPAPASPSQTLSTADHTFNFMDPTADFADCGIQLEAGNKSSLDGVGVESAKDRGGVESSEDGGRVEDGLTLNEAVAMAERNSAHELGFVGDNGSVAVGGRGKSGSGAGKVKGRKRAPVKPYDRDAAKRQPWDSPQMDPHSSRSPAATDPAATAADSAGTLRAALLAAVPDISSAATAAAPTTALFAAAPPPSAAAIADSAGTLRAALLAVAPDISAAAMAASSPAVLAAEGVLLQVMDDMQYDLLRLLDDGEKDQSFVAAAPSSSPSSSPAPLGTPQKAPGTPPVPSAPMKVAPAQPITSIPAPARSSTSAASTPASATSPPAPAPRPAPVPSTSAAGQTKKEDHGELADLRAQLAAIKSQMLFLETREAIALERQVQRSPMMEANAFYLKQHAGREEHRAKGEVELVELVDSSDDEDEGVVLAHTSRWIDLKNKFVPQHSLAAQRGMFEVKPDPEGGEKDHSGGAGPSVSI